MLRAATTAIRRFPLFHDMVPLDENVADAPGEVGEALVGRSSEEGCSLCGRHHPRYSLHPVLLCFLDGIVHVQTHPGGRQSDSVRGACWYFTTRLGQRLKASC